MKRSIKSVLAGFMCAVILPSAFACGGGSAGGDANELTLFRWDFSYVNTAKKMNSPLYKAVSDAIGGVELTAITTGSDTWEDTITRRFNTNELPDLFITKGPESPDLYYKMIRDEAIVPVSDYVSETEYPNLYRQLQKYDFLKENVYYAEGKHWSVPINWSLEFAMYVRTDWIDNLNKPEKLTEILTDELGHTPSAAELEAGKFKQPDDLVEFYRLARAFTLYDPDENGQNDTYGYSSSDCYTDNWIYEAFGGYNHMIAAGDGYTNSSVTEGNKKAVAFINRLISEGIMDPDWVTNNVDDKQTKFMQGKVGMMLAHTWYNTILTGFMAANFGETIESATAKIDMIEPPAGPDGTRGVKGHPDFWTVICINADMGEAKIAKALELLDFLHSDEGLDLFLYGIEGIHYEEDESGEKVSKMGQNSKGFNYTLLSYERATVLGTYAWWTSDYFSPYATNADKIIAIMEKAKEYNTYDDVPYLQTPKYVEYSDSLQEFYETSITNMVRDKSFYSGEYSARGKVTWDNLIIVNDSLDNAWAAYTREYLDDYHGQEVIDEYNEYAKKLGY